MRRCPRMHSIGRHDQSSPIDLNKWHCPITYARARASTLIHRAAERPWSQVEIEYSLVHNSRRIDLLSNEDRPKFLFFLQPTSVQEYRSFKSDFPKDPL